MINAHPSRFGLHHVYLLSLIARQPNLVGWRDYLVIAIKLYSGGLRYSQVQSRVFINPDLITILKHFAIEQSTFIISYRYVMEGSTWPRSRSFAEVVC
jgi:hypothetical protein